VASSCECSNEALGSIKCGQFLDCGPVSFCVYSLCGCSKIILYTASEVIKYVLVSK
jgi:hypothetical protein